ncbi:hypothetical protein BDB00DRAFT_785428 [Zychaea mexicana]|uniref:uncharacterized protein n=1 Tax=Zychaea mexicana TaxID=64656 RepID=UPI0022FE2484|nr:uncharacterized protein BDB00DRAFT_785428 [Zychaea mexicana]KAI9496691.1 hypothetical protein BDB00DRAFT_785428 [Zychaea mexicana]
MDNHYFEPSTQPDGGELASKIVSLLSVGAMSMLFGIKTFNVQFKYLTYSRWLVLILYIISWGFTCAGMLFVTTNNGNYLSCFLSEMACDIFYSATKIIIYMWQVWVVSSVRQSRWKTKSYRVHMLLLCPYIGIAALLIIFHIAEIEESGICIIGLQPQASIPLLVYDFIFNLYFTVLFVRPLMKIGRSVQMDWKSSRLHEVALRTLAASTVCLLISFANILTLVVMNGRERGVLCLTCCTVDVTINVITIHWVTTNPTGKTNKEHNNISNSNPNDSMDPDDPTSRGRQHIHRQHDSQDKDTTFRRKTDLYNLGIDDYIADTAITPSYAVTSGGGTVGYAASGNLGSSGVNHSSNNNSNSNSNSLMQTTTGAVPIGMHDHYRYMNGRFVMITEKEDTDDDIGGESRPSSIQESQSSRKSLTKFGSSPTS